MAEEKGNTGNTGIDHDCWFACDRYTGTKEALISAGHCKAEWFPAEPVMFAGQRLGRQRVCRTFVIEDDRPRPAGNHTPRYQSVQVWDRADRLGRWTVTFPLSEAEQAKRREDYRRKYQVDETPQCAPAARVVDPVDPNVVEARAYELMRKVLEKARRGA